MLRQNLGLAISVALLVPACRDAPPAAGKQPLATPAAATEAPAPAKPTSVGACGAESRTEALAEGLELLTIAPPTSAAVSVADRCLRVLRADLSLYALGVGAASRDGGALTAPRWAERDRRTVAVINASMYHDGGASTGLLIDGGAVLTDTVNGKFGAFLAANPKPTTTDARPAILWGRSCGGHALPSLRRDYSTVVQNYRLLDCDGQPIAWKDEKVYSAAAVGVDRSGRVLFIHSRAPYKMSTFTELLVDPRLGLDLQAAMYVEGGPEATLFVSTEKKSGLFIGSYESRFLENDDNAAPWPLPNVLVLMRRN